MGNLETREVWCIFCKEDDQPKELVHIALTEEEADRFIDTLVGEYMKDQEYSRNRIRVYGNGITITHYVDRAVDGTNYDHELRFIKDNKYGKLLYEE